MKKLSLFVILSLIFVLGINTARAENNTEERGVACTMDARVCPDGSFVGRGGPNCEFEKCPGEEEKEEIKTPDVLPIQTLNGDKEATREEIKQKMEAEREKTRKEIEARREELKTKMGVLKESIKKEKNTAKAKIKGEIITGRENVLLRFDKVVDNMTELKDRIGAQIAYLKTKSIDTTGAEAFIATVETKLNEIRVKIVEAHSIFSGSLNELGAADKTTLQNITKEIQDITNEIRDTLNNAVKSLKDSIISKK